MDRRDRVAVEGKWYDAFDEKTMTATVRYENGEGVEDDVQIPCHMEVCGTCDGRGLHVNPSIDAHGITPEEFAEDPDFRESYFRGDYDQPCAECEGRRVVPVPDEDRLTPEAREALAYTEEVQRGRYADARTMRMESGQW